MAELPPGWIQGHDVTHDRPYYFHRPSRRSTWTKPGFEAASLAEETKNDSDSDSDSDQSTSFRRAQFDASSITKSMSSSNTTNSTIAAQQKAVGRFAEWIEVFSPEHNRVFYYNKITRDSQWTDPRNDPRLLYQSSSPSAASMMMNRSSSSSQEVDKKITMIKSDKAPNGFLSVWETVGPAGSWSTEEGVGAGSSMAASSTVAAARTTASTPACAVPSDRPPQNTPVITEKPKVLQSINGSSMAPTTPMARSAAASATIAPLSKQMHADNRLESELEMFAQSLAMKGESLKYHANLLTPEERRQAQNVSDQANEFSRTAEAMLNGGGADKQTKSSRFLGGLLGNSSGASSKTLNREYSLANWGNEPVRALEVKRAMKDVEKGVQYAKDELKAHGQAANEAQKVDIEGGYYTILGVPTDSTLEQLKKAYRRSMIKAHPDKVPLADREQALERSILLQNSFDCLSDEWERYLYDYFGLKRYLQNVKVLGCFKNYLLSGIEVIKHPRKGYPRRRFFWISPDFEWINTGPERILEPQEWEKTYIKGVRILDIIDITRGINTDVFARTGSRAKHNRYISLITPDRTLDIEMERPDRADFMFSRLSLLVIDHQKNKKWLQRYFELKTLKEALASRGSFRQAAPAPPSEAPPPPPTPPSEQQV